MEKRRSQFTRTNSSAANMQTLYDEIERIEKRYLFEDQHRNCACKKKQSRLRKTYSRIDSFDNEYLEEKFQIDRKVNILEFTNAEVRDRNRRNSSITPMAMRSLAIARQMYSLRDLSDRIAAIDRLGGWHGDSISALIFKSVQVHADIMALDAQTTRLLRETRSIMRELEDVRYLDDLIVLLNTDAGPVVHKEWPLGDLISPETEVEEGVAVVSM